MSASRNEAEKLRDTSTFSSTNILNIQNQPESYSSSHIAVIFNEVKHSEASVCLENKTFISGKHPPTSTLPELLPEALFLIFFLHVSPLKSLQRKESSADWKKQKPEFFFSQSSQTDLQERCDHVNGRQQAPSGFSSSVIASTATTTFVLGTSEKKLDCFFFSFFFVGTASSPCRAAEPTVTCENRESAANAPRCADSFVIR